MADENSTAAELEKTKAVALAFLGHCFLCEVDQVLALLAPDATWWVLGNPEKVRVSGLRDRPRIGRFLKNVRAGFPDGLRVTIEGITAEGERVAVEASSHASLPGGHEYRNQYHFLVRVRQGWVIEMREYLDTQYAYEVQQASQPPSA